MREHARRREWQNLVVVFRRNLRTEGPTCPWILDGPRLQRPPGGGKGGRGGQSAPRREPVLQTPHPLLRACWGNAGTLATPFHPMRMVPNAVSQEGDFLPAGRMSSTDMGLEVLSECTSSNWMMHTMFPWLRRIHSVNLHLIQRTRVPIPTLPNGNWLRVVAD